MNTEAVISGRLHLLRNRAAPDPSPTTRRHVYMLCTSIALILVDSTLPFSCFPRGLCFGKKCLAGWEEGFVVVLV